VRNYYTRSRSGKSSAIAEPKGIVENPYEIPFINTKSEVSCAMQWNSAFEFDCKEYNESELFPMVISHSHGALLSHKKQWRPSHGMSRSVRYEEMPKQKRNYDKVGFIFRLLTLCIPPPIIFGPIDGFS
jgi:hypothetical protein